MANVKATDLIDFTRASKGHALAKVSYSSELVTNGGFDTDSDWILPSGYSISGGVLLYDGTASLYRKAYQNLSTQAGKLYKLTFTLSGLSGSSIAFGLSQTSSATYLGYELYDEDGTYTLYVVADGTSCRVQIQNNLATQTFSVDNVSVKEVLFDQPDGTLQLFEHPNNTPRIEYDADGNLLGLLIEEARTNTIQYSEDFENSYWGKGGGFSIYGNNGIAPDGTRTATLITDGDSDSYMVKSGGIASNGQTKSIWARTVSGTGKVTLLKHNSVSAALFDLTEEWQRFELPVDTSETGGSSVYAIDFRAAGTTLTEAYIWGAQLETGAFATSYIRSNSGSSTSRSADVASISIDEFGFNNTEGTVVATIDRSGLQTSGNRYAWQLFESANARTAIYLSPSAEAIFSIEGGVQQVNTGIGSSVADQETKLAFAFATNDFAGCRNGATVVTDTSGTFNGDGYTTLQIGNNNNSEVMSGHIKSIQYIPKRLSNAKLQELTS